MSRIVILHVALSTVKPRPWQFRHGSYRYASRPVYWHAQWHIRTILEPLQWLHSTRTTRMAIPQSD